MHKKTLLATFAASMMLATTAQADTIKQGGTLTVPIINTGFVENFNPYTTKDTLHGIMFEPLFVLNNMTGETHYRLAESVEYSDDLKTITLKLRDGLEWSDGAPLTAEDVVFSFELTKKAPAFDVKAIWPTGNLTSITATDKQTVVFNLAEPDSTFLWSIGAYHIVPKHTWS
ncbi:ABC transporter substrate-binding protein, partial [Vibrio campbellii]|uniref:ABC transporter substrate-binding protein n=2 Tax=Vibrionaceae TaxID=641 RepID=UPI002F42C876